MIGAARLTRTVPAVNGASARGVWHRNWRVLFLALAAVDALALAVASAAAGLLRLQLDEVLPVVSLGDTDRHIFASILIIPALLLLFRLHGLYEVDRIFTGTREYAQIANAATYGLLITLALSYFAGGSPLVSRSWLLLAWLLTIGCVGMARFGARRVMRMLRRRGMLRTRVVIVGASTFGVTLAQQLQAATDEGVDVAGFLDEYLPIGQTLLGEVRVLGRPGDLLRPNPRYEADEYILVPQALPHERLEEITHFMASQEEVVVRVAVSSSDLLTNGVRMAERASVPLITLQRARLAGLEGVLKGGLDLCVSVSALLLLAPLTFAVLIRGYMAGHRPLLTRTAIYGAGGHTTALWLLNERITSWPPLRGVPALLAVLGRQLSLVGPRPIACSASEPLSPPLGLTTVKPGLTGPWRLSGPGASLEDQALQDLTYVRNYTIWEDIRILMESVRRLWTGHLSELLGRWETSDRLAPHEWRT